MIIGNFTYNKAKDTYTGEIKTLTLQRSKVEFRPTEGKNGKGPDYRVTVAGTPGAVELGAAWKRTSEAGREFLSGRAISRRKTGGGFAAPHDCGKGHKQQKTGRARRGRRPVLEASVRRLQPGAWCSDATRSGSRPCRCRRASRRR